MTVLVAKRRARHGTTLSVGELATVLSQSAVSACVPMPLVASKVKAATTVAASSATAAVVSATVVALTRGVLKTMFLTKVKTMSALVTAFLLASGVVLVGLTQSAPLAAQAGDTKEKPAQIEKAIQAQDADEIAKLRKENELLKKQIEVLKKEIEVLKKGAKAQPDAAVDPKIAKELELLKGTWNVESQEQGDVSLPKEKMKGYKFVFDGNKLTWEGAISMTKFGDKIGATDGAFPCDFKIDPSKEPKEIDITLHLQNIKKGDLTRLGIYEIKGDTLKVCYFTLNNGRRPPEFSTKGGFSTVGYIVLTRAKK
jgi:uncharacterized protein (TIGR03067 family)